MVAVPLHVLIVEDHAHTARMLADCLEADGHAVRTVTDGPAALAAAAEEPPDVALIDLTLASETKAKVATRV